MKLKGNILMLVFLIVVTLIGIELPRGIYMHDDDNMMTRVYLQEYNVNVVSESMNLEQKINALGSDDTIITEDKSSEISDDVKKMYLKQLDGELSGLLKYEWKAVIQEMLADSETTSSMHILDVFCIIDDKIYSYELGVVSFYNYELADMLQPGTIVFDIETGYIFNLEVILNGKSINPGYRDSIYVGETTFVITAINDEAVSYTVPDYDAELLAEEKLKADNIDNDSYFEDLSEYYGREITSDDMAYVSSYSIYLEPFSMKDTESKAMSLLFDYIYKFYADLY